MTRAGEPSCRQPPAFRDGLPRTAPATPAPRKRFFGLGIAFQNRGGAQGIALDQVISGSPAERAGFAAGMVIVEIDGQSTLGRSGEDCTRMVRDAGGTVSIKYYDPLTFKLRIAHRDQGLVSSCRTEGVPAGGLPDVANSPKNFAL